MRSRLFLMIFALAAVCAMAALFAGCGDDDDDDSSDDDDAGDDDDDSYEGPEEFRELCRGQDLAESMTAAGLQYDNGRAFSFARNQSVGDIEVVHFVPEGPFVLTKIHVRFGGDAGTAIIHVYSDYGRSWPDEENDLIEPIQIDVPADAGWVVLDVSDSELYFHPSQHFWIGYEHVGGTPWLSRDDGDEAEDGTPSSVDHSRLKDLDQIERWRDQGLAFVWAGLTSSYLIRAEGAYFCQWDDADRLMQDVTDAADLADYTQMRVGWSDLDGDRDDDIVLTSSGYLADSTAVLKNNGDKTFTDITESTGIGGHYQAINLMGDLDNDGDQDVYAGVYVPQDGTDEGARSTVFLNDGDGTFDELASAGVDYEATTSAAAFGDYDKDGNLDLYVGAWLIEYPYAPSFPDVLFKGAGDGSFTDVSESAGMGEDAQDGGLPCYGAVWGDYNNDGELDVYVGNYGRADNFLWENQGDGTFTEVGRAKGVYQQGIYPGGNTFGVDFGDFENDGDLDIYNAEIAHPRYQPSSDMNSLMRNLGEDEDYTFTDVRENVGITYDEGEVEVSWVDFDNDGDLDLSLSDLYTLHYARLYRQESDFSFTDVTYMAGVWVHDATNHAWSDFDDDGDVDLLITRRSDGGHVHLFENRMGEGNHWLKVRLAGTDSNADGVGARVRVIAGETTQMREVKGGKGHFNSQPSLVQHFGLGELDYVDGLEVTWPSGQVDQYTGIAADQTVTVTEGAADVEAD